MRATVLSTHLTELLKANVSDLLSYAEVAKLVKELPKEQAELLKDIVPAQISMSGIQRVLQMLLAERISIRDLSTILEGVAEAVAFTPQPGADRRACSHAAGAADLCTAHNAVRLSAADRAVGEMGAGLRRFHRRPGRRADAGDAAVAAVGVHHTRS